MVFLDTNYLVRFFTKDVEKQAREAQKVIENEKIYIAEIVLAETVYILETHYEAKKEDVCDKLFSFLNQPNVYTFSFAGLALEIYKNENISFYDSLLVSQAKDKKGKLKTFDEKLAKVFSTLEESRH